MHVILLVVCVKIINKHIVTNKDDFYKSNDVLYANLTAYNAITLLIARGAAECKLIQ